MSDGKKQPEDYEGLSRMIARLRKRGINVEEEIIEEEQILLSPPVDEPKSYTWKQRQIIATMETVIRENHNFSDWYRKFGKGIPMVVAKDLWSKATNA